MITRIFVALLLSCSVVCAADSDKSGKADPGAPPTEATIKQLLELTQAHKMVETMEGQMTTFMKQNMAQATQGQKITP